MGETYHAVMTAARTFPPLLQTCLGSPGPAQALRSVLDEESEKAFEQKEAKKKAGPPPEKSFREKMGLETDTKNKDSRGRPKNTEKTENGARKGSAAALLGL